MPKHPKYKRRRKLQQKKQKKYVTPTENEIIQPDSVYEEPELPSWTKKEDVIDYLSEDDTIPNQKYACVSMLSLSKWRAEQQREEAIEFICKKEGYSTELAKKIIDSWSEFAEPKRAFKIRGIYGEYSEARKRSEFLQRTHKNHNVAVMSVGFWVPFDPDPEKINDQNYMERELNELKEGYMKNREKGKEHFEEQKALKAQRARIEGSKWGQEQLLKRKETRQEVEYRAKAAEEDIAQYQEKIKRAEMLLEQAKNKLAYMEEHPEVVLEEVEQIDVEQVPEEVMKEIEENKSKVDENRAKLAEIEAKRKTFDRMPPQAAMPVKKENNLDDKLIMPHEAREEIKKQDQKTMKTI
jgi:hypothetical protein